MRLAVLGFAAFLSLASASTTSFSPTTVSAPAGVDDADLFASTLRVLHDEGYDIARADEDAGVVATDPGGPGGPRERFLYAWRIRVADGTLSLDIDCVHVDEHGLTGECLGDERPADMVSDEPRLRQAIFADAQRRA